MRQLMVELIGFLNRVQLNYKDLELDYDSKRHKDYHIDTLKVIDNLQGAGNSRTLQAFYFISLKFTLKNISNVTIIMTDTPHASKGLL